ncbi:sensor domain-containing protein [Flocculibacter collagenilyticus]|uniref:sensor domain-containing protein n=1 Tax=Flocculibacter collagenilyticus TaxID=2744479 RepID=UPI0018F503DD|nr:EAL domain-containing protein [Flocculibacter collagenilyticus]
MIKNNSRVLKRNALIIYAVIIIFTVGLLSVVYSNATSVKRDTLQFIDKYLPTLNLIREMGANLSEQERLIYEYYASQDSQLYTINFSNINQEIKQQAVTLSQLLDGQLPHQEIKAEQTELQELVKQFHINMDSNATDWDLARELLVNITDSRKNISRMLGALENETAHKVEIKYQDVVTQLNNTNLFVFSYSLIIFLLALIVGRYLLAYQSASEKANRLAQFAERTPNPIISINDAGQITYFNPATDSLLKALKLSHEELQKSVLNMIEKFFVNKSNKTEDVISFEHIMMTKTFSCQLHWLKDLNQYDLHITDITERKVAENQLQFQAFHIQETGLKNKNKLLLDLSDQLTDKPEQHFSLCLVEIRQFNLLTSTNGLKAASEVSTQFAKCLASIFNHEQSNVHHPHSSQAPYQLSESVFAFYLPWLEGTDPSPDVHSSIEKHLESTISTRYGDFLIECDMGVSYYPDHGESIPTLLQRSRMALEHAITLEHINRIVFDHSFSQQLERTVFLTDSLRTAIASQELALFFQPQLALKNNKIVGFESLIRWQHQNNFISPAEFIPVAEHSGLIISLGEWILNRACEVAAQWVDQFDSKLVIAVNISPRQFRHPDFIEHVKNALQRHQLPPHNLELEITEGVIMHNEEDVIEQLHALKAIGVQLSIDDFGTGYSSLAYLKQFPIDKLKIDQSFVKDSHNNKADQAIIRTIVDLGKNLDVQLIAEGVEEQAHVDYLKSIQCDELQGYWFSRPLNVEDATELLENHEVK